ncbi:DUF5683 domain-containing protein [Mucilaginibacter terrae]|uniref:DUF5683 domain-containing protein n=1 Tax=Mucilaginibacter terrae TaxID=1955052 RepID=UPI0036429579
MNRLLLICILALFSFTASAQKPDTVKNKSVNDSLTRVRDSVVSKPVIPVILSKKNKKQYNPDSTHSPGLAFKRSGFVPGWGQLYNHRWWKVPLVYGGLVSLGLAVEFNQRYYKQYLRVYRLKQNAEQPGDGDSQDVKTLYNNVSGVSITAIEGAVTGYQRNMQLSILGMVGFWGIQMVDAYIDAKFIHSYTMDRDLSFKISPGVITGPVYASSNIPSVMPVLKLTFTLK